MLLAISIFSVLFGIAAPIALAWALRRRLGTRVALFGWGALAFIASQIVHFPILIGLTAAFRAGVLPQPPASWIWFNPLLLGMLAGLCEEPARWLFFKLVL